MIPKYIFCQCMKPWKLCVNKPNSYKIDTRGLIDIYRLRIPFLSETNSQSINEKYNINYDFINMRPTNTPFVCRFHNKKPQ